MTTSILSSILYSKILKSINYNQSDYIRYLVNTTHIINGSLIIERIKENL